MIKAKERYLNNKTLLENFRNNASPEMQQFIDHLLMINKTDGNLPKARLSVDVGKKINENKFLSFLSTVTKKPYVAITSYQNKEPQIIFNNNNYRIRENLFLVNLTDISNLQIDKIKNDETSAYISCTFHLVHSNIDYQLSLTVNK